MKKIEFKNLPSKETPLSASNLNLMQQNIEDEINKINKYFEIPKGDRRPRWVKIADFATDIGLSINGMQIKIYGTIRFGSNRPGFDIVEASTRGGMNITILGFNHTSNAENQRYGYVNNPNGRTELWIEQEPYNYRTTVEVTNVIDCKIGLLAMQYERPAGYVGMEKTIVATEKALLAVYNNQTGNIRIDGGNYEAKQVPFNNVFTQRGTAFRLGPNEIIVNKKCNARITFTLYCLQFSTGQRHNIEAKLWVKRRRE